MHHAMVASVMRTRPARKVTTHSTLGHAADACSTCMDAPHLDDGAAAGSQGEVCGRNRGRAVGDRDATRRALLERHNPGHAVGAGSHACRLGRKCDGDAAAALGYLQGVLCGARRLPQHEALRRGRRFGAMCVGGDDGEVDVVEE